MDEFGSKNIRMVLLTVIVLAVSFGAVLLYLAATGKEVPDLVSNGFTTLLGVLTGSVVSLGAKPRVDQVKKALEVASTPVATAGATVAGGLVEGLEDGFELLDPEESEEEDDLSDVSAEEIEDDSVPDKETDASGI